MKIPTKKSAYLACFLSLFVTEPLSHGADFFIGAGGAYDQLQITNSAGTGDSYYTGVGYAITAMIRMQMGDLWGSYRNFQSSNTADSAEKNLLSPVSFGLQTRIGYFLLGADYQLTSSRITTSSTLTNKNYGSLGVSAGIEIPLSAQFVVQLMAFQHMGLAPGSLGNSGSRAVNEFTAGVFLQFRVFRFLGGDETISPYSSRFSNSATWSHRNET